MAVAPSLTGTTGLASMIAVIYDKQLLAREKQELVFKQLCWIKSIPQNMGTTIQFQAYRPLAVVTSSLNSGTDFEGSAGSHSEYALSSRQVTIQPREWGATAPISTLYHMTKIDPGLTEQIDIVADQRNRSIDRQIALEVGRNGIFPIRADQDTAYTAHGIRLIATNASTSQFRINTNDDAITAVTNAGAGAIVCVTSGTNYGYTGRISTTSTSAATGMLVTLKITVGHRAAPKDFTASDVITIVDQSTMAIGDVLTSINLRAARKHLRKNRAPFFDGNNWVAAVSPDTEYDFLGDSTFVLTAQYSDARKLYNGEMGQWMGIRFVGTTQPYRETILGVADMDDPQGPVFHNFVFGNKAVGFGELSGGDQGIVVLQGSTKSDPLNMVTTVGWKSIFEPRSLTSPHCVSILTSATENAF